MERFLQLSDFGFRRLKRAYVAEVAFTLAFLAAAIPNTNGQDNTAAGSRTPDASRSENDVVRLRPFIVTGTRIQNPWRYVAIPGYEVISRCDDPETVEYVGSLLRGNIMMKAALPDGCLSPLATPAKVILYYGLSDAKGTAAVISQKTAKGLDEALWRTRDTWDYIRTADVQSEDTTIRCLEMPPLFRDPLTRESSGYAGIGAWTMPSFRFRLRHRVPQFPAWLVVGLIGPGGLHHGPNILQSPRDIRSPTQLLYPTAQWVNDSETVAIRESRTAGTPLIPLAGLFEQKDLSELFHPSVWSSEAALFVRWGMFGHAYGEDGSDPRAFWEFVNETTAGPVTDEKFRSCFGFGYAEMETRLKKFLPKAVREILAKDMDIDMDTDPSVPPLRNATAAEIARIVGDWGRLQGEALKIVDPNLSRELLDEAGRELAKPYVNGSRDSDYLGVLGLYDYSVGQNEEAHKLLEEAVKRHVTRPSVYLRAAQLRYSAGAAHPLGKVGRLSLAQVTSILEPLAVAQAQPPAMVETYLLMAEVWSKSDTKPSPRDFATLSEAEKLFWTDARLTTAIDNICAQWKAAGGS